MIRALSLSRRSIKNCYCPSDIRQSLKHTSRREPLISSSFPYHQSFSLIRVRLSLWLTCVCVWRPFWRYHQGTDHEIYQINVN